VIYELYHIGQHAYSPISGERLSRECGESHTTSRKIFPVFENKLTQINDYQHYNTAYQKIRLRQSLGFDKLNSNLDKILKLSLFLSKLCVPETVTFVLFTSRKFFLFNSVN
jgi:hypothetical protein